MRRFVRTIGWYCGINYSRMSRIVSNAERQRARGKTVSDPDSLGIHHS
jgi:hypothetical protein